MGKVGGELDNGRMLAYKLITMIIVMVIMIK